MIFYSIGVYGTSEKSFFDKLIHNKIDTFCDIRNRRGVRGATYSYVNSKKLQEKLQQLEIKYLYVQDLAPTKEIRDFQKVEDKQNGILKSKRIGLGFTFIQEYEKRILDRFDFNSFIKGLKEKASDNIVLFCVEEDVNACHRSIVANRLFTTFGMSIKHIK